MKELRTGQATTEKCPRTATSNYCEFGVNNDTSRLHILSWRFFLVLH